MKNQNLLNEGVSGSTFNGEINWDGRFADGTVAPPGAYLVWVKTADNAGNETFQLGKVTVEDSIFNWFIPPSKTPIPSATSTLPPTAQATKQAVLAPAPTKPAIVVSSSAFGGKSQTGTIPASSQNNLPLVSAAIAAMAAAAAYALQRKREEDEAAKEEQEAKMRAKARAKAEAEWDRASAKKKVEQERTSNVYAQLRRQEVEKERTSQTYAALRQQAAEKERQKTIDDFRKGEHAPGNVVVPQAKSWLENAWDNTKNFVQQKIVQPVQKVLNNITTVAQNVLTSKTLLRATITTATVVTSTIILQHCIPTLNGSTTPDVNAIYTQAAQTIIVKLQMTQAAFTPTPMPTATIVLTADSLNSSVPLYQLAAYLYSTGVSECAPDKQNSSECLAKLAQWSNRYNQIILDAAKDPKNPWAGKIDPVILAVMYKRIALNETQFVPDAVTGNEKGSGFAQITPATLQQLITAGLISLPERYPTDETSLITILQDPAFNARAGMANLAFLYNGVKNSNNAKGWQMSEETIWKLVAALHNTGAQSNSGVINVGSTFDFWQGLREKMQNDTEFERITQCNDPNDWECLKAALRMYVPLTYKKDPTTGKYITDPNTGEYILISGGKCSSEYADSVAPANMVNNPLSPEVLNVPVRPECKTSVAPKN